MNRPVWAATSALIVTLTIYAPAFAGSYGDTDVRYTPSAYKDYDVIARPTELCTPYTVTRRCPDRYETVSYTVEVAPARCVTRWVPAQKKTIYDVCGRPCREVVVRPAYCVREIIPAKYETRRHRVRVQGQWQRTAPLDPCVTVHGTSTATYNCCN